MADVQARKAAIKKASSQVRTGGVFVHRASTTGGFRSGRSVRVTSVGASGKAAKSSPKESR